MYASFLNRLKAFILDYILIFLYLVLLAIINVFLFPSLQNLFSGSLIIAQLTGFLMVTLPVSIYFIVSDSKIVGQSFGKKKIGIRVVGPNGKPASVLRSTCRIILKFLPWELSHFLVYRLAYIGDGAVPVAYYLIGGLIYLLMFIYIGTAIFTKKKQSLYDQLTKTFVVKN
ncbi:RDD family protein [Alkalicoccobacillus porphyridii]|uniref:RDD family protein n=1 Tax=Alkalicoccobacillus porphyridii TaxID=2597270 RepID=A0A553ZYM0_9BACI|nr:RDD family protein [Alkalicoccobacillus porphyridii]TSB46534.1 RDD family protein [Alkalicoccobacillus porphyridii]